MRAKPSTQTREAVSGGAHQRMQWWREARFGMFVHWGLYSQLARHEWVMNRERIPAAEYEKLAATWKPKPRPAREWAALAKNAGMKYMVLTVKHLEGFCLWDTKLTDYCAPRTGPGRDLVREYVEACRGAGLKVGYHFCLSDWHHPDCARSTRDEAVRRRYLDFIQGCLRELMSNYGRIDILWYDAPFPLTSPALWESAKMNAMVRRLQPRIIINNRSLLPEDFETPEEHITPAAAGRGWEACMTFNGSWGWQPAPPEDWHSARKVIEMLRTCAAGGGNLLLNIGPKPDGSAPQEAVERLTTVGRWLKTYGKAVYGPVDRVQGMCNMPTGDWSRKERTLYFWCSRWPGRTLTIGGLRGTLLKASLVTTGRPIAFTQEYDRLLLTGLPAACPDKVAGVALLKLSFATVPHQVLGYGCEYVRSEQYGQCQSAFITEWKRSRVMPKTGNLAEAPCVRLRDNLNWTPIQGEAGGLVNLHSVFGDADGLVYLANRFTVSRAGSWILDLGHDGGVRVFVDGRSVLCEPEQLNPVYPGRSHVLVKLDQGIHEIVVAFDLNCGGSWGMLFRFAIPVAADGKKVKKPVFPQAIESPCSRKRLNADNIERIPFGLVKQSAT